MGRFIMKLSGAMLGLMELKVKETNNMKDQ